MINEVNETVQKYDKVLFDFISLYQGGYKIDGEDS